VTERSDVLVVAGTGETQDLILSAVAAQELARAAVHVGEGPVPVEREEALADGLEDLFDLRVVRVHAGAHLEQFACMVRGIHGASPLPGRPLGEGD